MPSDLVTDLEGAFQVDTRAGFPLAQVRPGERFLARLHGKPRAWVAPNISHGQTDPVTGNRYPYVEVVGLVGSSNPDIENTNALDAEDFANVGHNASEHRFAFRCIGSGRPVEPLAQDFRLCRTWLSVRRPQFAALNDCDRRLKPLRDRVPARDRSESSRRVNSVCIASPPDMHDVRTDPTLFHQLEFRSHGKLTDAKGADRRLALRPQDLARRKDHQLIDQPC